MTCMKKSCLILLLIVTLLVPACAWAEEIYMPFYSAYPASPDDNAWLEIPNAYEMMVLPTSYTLAYLMDPAQMSMARIGMFAHIPEGFVQQPGDQDVSGFAEDGRKVLDGAEKTEASTVIERYEINDLPAVRVDMTGQGYEMIWVADGGDMYFFMYPLADADFARTMRGVADSFHLVEAKTAPACNPADYEYTADERGVTITKYTGEKQRVAVPSEIDGKPVVALGKNAFYESDVTWLSIPDSVQEIGTFCFSGCSGLQTLYLPQGLKEIPACMLESCFRLLALDIPDSVTTIGDGVFWGNFYLSELRLPASLETLGGMNFTTNLSLERFIVPAENTHFATQDEGKVLLSADGKRFIHYCAWQERESYTIPDGVERIDSFAFLDMSKLTEVIVPEGVTTIEAAAFLHAYRLKRLVLPVSAVELGVGEDNGTGQITGYATIVAPEGSAAQAYAEQFKHKFEAVPAAENTNQSEQKE